MTCLWLLVIITCVAVSSFAQSDKRLGFHATGFSLTSLSPKGRAAYQKLLIAERFTVGGVGWGATISQTEFALHDLLNEKDPIAALKSLVTEASYAGGLYGLLGLKIANPEGFNRAVEIYKARKEPRLRPSLIPLKGKGYKLMVPNNPFIGIELSKDEVITASGCLIFYKHRAQLVASIEADEYDEILLRDMRSARGNQSTPFILH